MALKGERIERVVETQLSCEAITNRGVTLCYGDFPGSGAVLGATAGTAELYTNPSGKKPVGILLVDVVNTDQTRYHLNFYKNEVPSGVPVPILKQGRLTLTNFSGTPAAGDTAYLTTNGDLTPTLSTTGGLVATPRVGQFVGSKDADNYVTVDIQLP